MVSLALVDEDRAAELDADDEPSDELILKSATTGLEAINERICSVKFTVSPTVGWLVSARLEFSRSVLPDDEEDDDVDAGKWEVGFLNCKFNGNGLFSLIRLRGNCMAVSSFVAAAAVVLVVADEGDVDAALTALDNGEWLVTTMAGIDAADDMLDGSWSEEIDDEGSISSADDVESVDVTVAGANGWESTETADDCDSKHVWKHQVENRMTLLFSCENHKRTTKGDEWKEID